MAYFQANERKVLKIIKTLTTEQPFTSQNLVYNASPKDWGLQGFGTGNLQNTLVNLYRQNKIGTATLDPAFLQGTDTANKQFFITDKGRQELRPWMVRHWQIIFGVLVSISTIITAIYSALEFYKH